MARFRPHRMYPGALLAQEACSYQGATEVLARIDGRLAVLIHSDRDCSNVVPKTGRPIAGDLPYKFLCTNLKEDELVTGQGGAKLAKALRLVAEAWQPALTVVLSTCPTVMIGDNLRNIAKKAGRDLGIRVESELTHGLRPVSPAEVVDKVFSLLARASLPSRTDLSRRVNLVGLDLREDELAELREGLAALGLEVNAVLSTDTHLDDFLRAADAAWSIQPGPNLLVGYAQMAQEQWGQRLIEVPIPCGVQATDAFWSKVAAATGADSANPLPVERHEAAEAVAQFRSRFAPLLEKGRLRCAYNIGSVRSFDLRRIALEELGDLPMFQELGFSCDLMIQGPQDAANDQRTAQVLLDLACDLPFCLFPAPGNLVQFLGKGVYQLLYGADFLRDQSSQAGVALLNHRGTGLGYRQARPNIERVQQALDNQFYSLFEADEQQVTDALARVELLRPSERLAQAPAAQPEPREDGGARPATR